jgi:uncharacterized DUF497 family protein
MLDWENAEFEWDEKKNAENKRKHKISFEEAIHVFLDPFSVKRRDEIHSTETEERWTIVGSIQDMLVVFVVCTERGNKLRIISARKADKNDKEASMTLLTFRLISKRGTSRLTFYRGYR